MNFSDVFLFAFNAITPIVLLILLGFFLKKINLFNDPFLQTANKFVFNCCLPVLLFYNVYNIGNLGEISWGTVFFALGTIFVFFLLGFVFTRFFIKDRMQKGVIWQAFYRSNFAIIGIPLAESLGGSEGVVIASILSAFSIPVFNALAVVSLSVYTSSDGENRASPKKILLNIAKNPLIIGVLTGFIVLGIRSFIPVDADGIAVFTIKNNLPFLFDVIEKVARIASPLALIVLGGKFRFDAVKALKNQIIAGTAARIVAAPLLGILFAVICEKTGIIDFGPAHYASFIALFGSPVAVSSAIMASRMKNDGQLANQILVWSSIGSVFTVFFAVLVLKQAGIL